MADHKFKFDNGVKAESRITGLTGTIVSRANHINGCDRYHLQPRLNKDGDVPDGYWFDEQELIILKEKKIEPPIEKKGGFPSKSL